MLFGFSCAFAQKTDICCEKDLGWAKWVFTSIEFNDDYTTVSGHIIPGKNDCEVWTEKTEVLQANGKEYRLLETTLPLKNIWIKNVSQCGDTIMFVEKFEPIMSLNGTVSYKDENFDIDIANVCINIKPDLQRKYTTYAKKILGRQDDVFGEMECLRYLSHCAEELSLMHKDSAAIARSYLGNCYDAHGIFMNSYPKHILNTWGIIKEIHHGITGKRLKKSEQKYLDRVAEFVNEAYRKSQILSADNIKAMREKSETVFREADKKTELYKRTLVSFGDPADIFSLRKSFKSVKNVYEQALDKYNAGDYAGAYALCPSSIHFNYKVLSQEDFKEYCDSIYADCNSTLVKKVNIPRSYLISYGGMHSDLWNFLEITPLLETIPYFAMETNNPEIICHALNGILNAKAFRYYADRYMKERLSGFNSFNSSNGFNETPEASETAETPLVLYRKIQSESAALAEMYEDGLADESVYQKAEEIKNLKQEYTDYQESHPINTEDFLVEWDSVRNSLKPKELAVEFQKFPIWNTDSLCYIAITYRHDSSIPRLYTVLKDKKESLSSYNSYNSFNSFNGSNGSNETSEPSEPSKSYALSAKVWNAMKDELVDVESVYFSASGILHSLPLENCDTTRLYHRLTSTKELLKRQKTLEQQLRTCVLYGGLEYGSNGYSRSNESKMSPMLNTRQMRDFTARGPLDDISEQSEAEVNTIASLLQEKGMETKVFKRQDGTEETFKALADTNVDAIHISTHGFYWETYGGAVPSPHQSSNTADYSFLKLEDSKLPDNEKAMVRSALLFAGAQEAIEGGTKKQGMENGVLTAKEISTMTFPNLKLVVLSACQSGLGDVDASEGSLGLQRAFKTAGAKTILMTLHEVDNHATRLLMEEFYRQYLSGNSMSRALRNAQSFLRNYEEDGINPYKDPKYWAYFTLLDALD